MSRGSDVFGVGRPARDVLVDSSLAPQDDRHGFRLESLQLTRHCHMLRSLTCVARCEARCTFCWKCGASSRRRHVPFLGRADQGCSHGGPRCEPPKKASRGGASLGLASPCPEVPFNTALSPCFASSHTMRRLLCTLLCAACLQRIIASLDEGLTLGWITPIFRRRFLPADDDAVVRVRDTILAWHKTFSSGSPDACGVDAVSLNDRFYEAQRERFEEGKPPAFDSPTLREWRRAWLDLIREYVSVAAGPEASERMFSRELQLFVWAGVHRGCSHHPTHIHEDSAVSGTLYLDVPPGSGAIVFEDPRGLRPPFSRNRLTHQPEVGQLLLFPPWLSHGVQPSCDVAAAAGAARVALSFNVLSVPIAGKSSNTDWEVLADASLHIPTE